MIDLVINSFFCVHHITCMCTCICICAYTCICACTYMTDVVIKSFFFLFSFSMGYIIANDWPFALKGTIVFKLLSILIPFPKGVRQQRNNAIMLWTFLFE